MGQTGYYTPTAIKPLGERPNPHGGTLATFACDFKDAADNVRTNVYWARKAGNDPQVGQSYYGEMQDGDKGPRFFTRTAPPDGSAPLPSASQPSSQAPNPDPRGSRIERQHSQSVAVEFLAATGSINGLELENEQMVAAYLNGPLRKLIDYFHRDVDRKPQPPPDDHPSEGLPQA